MRRSSAVLLAAALLASGCGGLQATKPPATTLTVDLPDVQSASPVIEQALGEQVEQLIRDSAKRRARKVTLRVRNVSCVGVATGSAFAITQDLLITNRHVLAGAELLEINTWDGRTHQVTAAGVGTLGDIGIAQVDEPLPQASRLATRRARKGDPVTVVGYPLGGPLTPVAGTIIDRVSGERFDLPGDVLRIAARVLPGNSGGPVLNQRGRVVAVLFGIEIASGYALAIPTDTMLHLIEQGGLEPIPPCGEP